MKTVSVAYGENGYKYDLSVGSSGEIQTVNNSFISAETQAAKVAEIVKDALESRKRVKGSFRGDPRLDLFDIVFVETKYGGMMGIVITNIKYTFNGTFNGSYEGRVLDGIVPVLGTFVLDVSRLM